MCGIAGYVGFTEDSGLLGRMTRTLAHRGPDDEGQYLHGPVGLGHRRLSIIDLSDAGHQPMSDAEGTLWITYNGEIYNYLEVAAELRAKGHTFRSRTDTEAVLHAYKEWGPACLGRFNGMFALAIYDQTTDDLFLARDRIGIKPLYYWNEGNRLLFGSEIKAVLEAGAVAREPSLAAIAQYLKLRFVPGPGTMVQGVCKFPPGHYAHFAHGTLTLHHYWAPEPYDGPYRDDAYYHEPFADLFEKAVRRRLMSDVPFGAYLSGGLDSSVIVGMMTKLLDHPVKAFAAGFGSPKDELSAAGAVAEHFGTDHQEVICTASDLDRLPQLVWNLDEPQGDAIILPSYLLSLAASKQVKMVLTGEGADETMAGYQFHQVVAWSRQYADYVPSLLHRSIAMPLLRLTPPRLFSRGFSHPGDLGEKRKRRIVAFANRLHGASVSEQYHSLISLFDDADVRDLAVTPFGQATPTDGIDGLRATSNRLEQVLHLQYADWLPNNILWRQDRMSMANSIEGRVPFLDDELVEFLATVPARLKVRRLREKYILRHFARGLLPPTAARRKKQPFYIPLDRYVEAPEFKALVDRTLAPDAVAKRGLFRPEAVEGLLKRVQSGDFLYAKQVFALIVLELWFQVFIDRERTGVSADS